MVLNNRLKVLRAAREITQGDLALEIGVSRKTINTIEKGRFVPTTITALKLAAFFRVAVEEVFWLTPGMDMEEKKHIKRQFKEAVKPCGICRITNLISGKMFMFASTNTLATIRRQQFELKMNSHRNRKLQKEYNDQGSENFVFDVPWSIEKPEKEDNIERALQRLMEKACAQFDENDFY